MLLKFTVIFPVCRENNSDLGKSRTPATAIQSGLWNQSLVESPVVPKYQRDIHHNWAYIAYEGEPDKPEIDKLLEESLLGSFEVRFRPIVNIH